MLEPEVFRKQIYGIEESSCGIVGTFRRPRSDSVLHSDPAPGELCPLAPLMTPLLASKERFINLQAIT